MPGAPSSFLLLVVTIHHSPLSVNLTTHPLPSLGRGGARHGGPTNRLQGPHGSGGGLLGPAAKLGLLSPAGTIFQEQWQIVSWDSSDMFGNYCNYYMTYISLLWIQSVFKSRMPASIMALGYLWLHWNYNWFFAAFAAEKVSRTESQSNTVNCNCTESLLRGEWVWAISGLRAVSRAGTRLWSRRTCCADHWIHQGWRVYLVTVIITKYYWDPPNRRKNRSPHIPTKHALIMDTVPLST